MSVQFQAENLAKSYGGRVVIDAVSFNLRDGGTLCATGPNGSGKSTLLRLCAGLLRPDAGNTLLFVDGLRAETAGSRSCAFVSPALRWYGELTAREQIALLHSRDMEKSSRCESFCRRFGLDAFLDTRLAQYSSGMNQRFSLAMAFGLNAPLVILDEPSSFLDVEGKDIFRGIFREESPSRVFIIAANDPGDATLCEKEVRLG